MDLLTRCRRLDRSAWSALYQGNAPTVARMLHHLLGPVPDLDDLVQQVFLGLVSSLDRMHPGVRLTTWIYGISVNVARDYVRGEKRRNRLRLAYAECVSGTASVSMDPEHGAEARRYLALLNRVLQTMSFKNRAVWVMHEIENLDCEEIAAALDTAAVTVRVRLYRARREVTQALLEAGLDRSILESSAAGSRHGEPGE